MDPAAAKNQRRSLKGCLTRALAFVIGIDKDTTTVQTLRNKRAIVEGYFKRFDELQTLIEDAAPDEAEIALQVAERDDTEAKYLEIISKLDEMIEQKYPQQSQPGPSSASSHSAATNLKLPRIELPVFYGKYEDWPSFSDLFTATVDKNASLSGAQKLQYLKSYLKGDAEVLVKSFTITDCHYQEAWTLLNDRYDNQREIVHSLCRRLLHQPAIKCEGANNIQTLLNVTNECIRSLQVQKVNTSNWDNLLIVIIIEKLDPFTRSEWAKQLKGTKPPAFKELQEFLEQHIRSLHARGIVGNKPANSSGTKSQVSSHHVAVSTTACPACQQDHPLYKCEKFNRMSTYERNQLITNSSACRNCLRTGHVSRDCTSKSTCKKCNKPHNTLLHFEKRNTTAGAKPGPSTQSQQGNGNPAPASNQGSTSNFHTSTFCGHMKEAQAQVLLKTAIVHIKDSSGQMQKCRVLFDDCSESSFITERCVSALGLRKHAANVEVKGISAASIIHVKSKVITTLSSIVHEGSISIEAYVLQQVTGKLPRFHCNPREWTHIQGIELADPNFHTPGDVDILLGADIVAAVVREGIRRGSGLTPLAQNTLFGWVLSGKVAISEPSIIHTFHTTTVEEILHKFWALEEVPNVTHFTEEEKAAENHFMSTHRRQEDGRYLVRLPFNEKLPDLGESKSLAMQRLFHLERRFKKYPHYHTQYIDFMTEYSALGHMRLVRESEINRKAVYLPHHFVTKLESTSTKLRVVYDASSRTSSGISLNDTLMVGPTIQTDLFKLLIKFRYHLVAVKADITKMYRQFTVDPSDSNYQRILWREDSNQPVREYNLTTVTYGTASAPFLATRCLKKLSLDEGLHFPTAAKAIDEDMYVDDLLSGASTSAEAIQLYNDVSEIIQRGGMQIRKWATNDPEVLNHIPAEYRETDMSLNFDADLTIKALGVRWNPGSDTFSFVVNQYDQMHITKRQLLSQLAKVFDPLGLLTPITVNAKLIFQQLWKDKCGWDEFISDSLQQQWISYQQQMPLLTKIQIPRCVISSTALNYQLHGFSDSSERAYACVLFLRCQGSEDVQVNQIAAKSKVAPLKPQCIHRLELCGALLLAELVHTVQKTLPFQCELYAWSDSMITIKWLSSHPSRWKTFVANRVARIHELIPADKWHHVRGCENPADPASRGISPEEFLQCKLWWNGPEWLKTDFYPIHPSDIDFKAVSVEERAKPVFAAATQAQVLCDSISKFSSLLRLKRVFSYCLRFVYNCKGASRKTGFITSNELRAALNALIKSVQQEVFKADIQSLLTEGTVHNSSKLKQLNPFVDEFGLLRVGGRINQMKTTTDVRHPLILPNNHHLTTLIIRECHFNNLHSGLTLTLATLQQNFWIIRGRDTVRHIIRKCITCRKIRATTCQQLMGSLPATRVNPSRPFQNSGVDFAGPYAIKISRGRGQRCQKCYFCIFVCFATKAVHLEVVMDMTSQSFLATFKRFVSRRGVPSNMYSDNGTNFVGAEKELRVLYANLKCESLANTFAEKGVNWHFNSPASPHQGGIFEAGVKAVKYHLRRVVGNATMTLEQFQTLLCCIEACLNSRPLCALSSDPGDLEALTPSHFLVGATLTAIPENDCLTTPSNRLDYWQLVQQLSQRFWKRWSTEYVTSLQQRFKWCKKRANLQQNDLVVIKDDQLPPTKWKIGRVIETHPASDDCVRNVTLQTTHGIIKRSIVHDSLMEFVEVSSRRKQGVSSSKCV